MELILFLSFFGLIDLGIIMWGVNQLRKQQSHKIS